MRQTLLFIRNIATLKNVNFPFYSVLCKYQEFFEFGGKTDH